MHLGVFFEGDDGEIKLNGSCMSDPDGKFNADQVADFVSRSNELQNKHRCAFLYTGATHADLMQATGMPPPGARRSNGGPAPERTCEFAAMLQFRNHDDCYTAHRALEGLQWGQWDWVSGKGRTDALPKMGSMPDKAAALADACYRSLFEHTHGEPAHTASGVAASAMHSMMRVGDRLCLDSNAGCGDPEIAAYVAAAIIQHYDLPPAGFSYTVASRPPRPSDPTVGAFWCTPDGKAERMDPSDWMRSREQRIDPRRRAMGPQQGPHPEYEGAPHRAVGQPGRFSSELRPRPPAPRPRGQHMTDMELINALNERIARHLKLNRERGIWPWPQPRPDEATLAWLRLYLLCLQSVCSRFTAQCLFFLSVSLLFSGVAGLAQNEWLPYLQPYVGQLLWGETVCEWALVVVVAHWMLRGAPRIVPPQDEDATAGATQPPS